MPLRIRSTVRRGSVSVPRPRLRVSTSGSGKASSVRAYDPALPVPRGHAYTARARARARGRGSRAQGGDANAAAARVQSWLAWQRSKLRRPCLYSCGAWASLAALRTPPPPPPPPLPLHVQPIMMGTDAEGVAETPKRDEAGDKGSPGCADAAPTGAQPEAQEAPVLGGSAIAGVIMATPIAPSPTSSRTKGHVEVGIVRTKVNSEGVVLYVIEVCEFQAPAAAAEKADCPPPLKHEIEHRYSTCVSQRRAGAGSGLHAVEFVCSALPPLSLPPLFVYA